MSNLLRLACLAALAAVGASAARPDADVEPKTAPKPEAVARWSKGDAIVLAKVTAAGYKAATMSLPPTYLYTISFAVEDCYRGGLKKGDKYDVRFASKDAKLDRFAGKETLIALNKMGARPGAAAGWGIVEMFESSKEEIKQAKFAAALPPGWGVEKGGVVSPWAAFGKKGWPEAAKATGEFVCLKTGRPALMLGEGVTLSVEAVKPKVEVKFTNPDGDGEYKVTVKNTTAKAVTVPALLQSGKEILWNECVVILCQGKTYTAPGAKGIDKPVTAVKLEPGAEVSGTVNALALRGPTWPMGGYRIEFRICLGEQSETKSFYYTSRHHDAIRDASGGK